MDGSATDVAHASCTHARRTSTEVGAASSKMSATPAEVGTTSSTTEVASTATSHMATSTTTMAAATTATAGVCQTWKPDSGHSQHETKNVFLNPHRCPLLLIAFAVRRFLRTSEKRL